MMILLSPDIRNEQLQYIQNTLQETSIQNRQGSIFLVFLQKNKNMSIQQNSNIIIILFGSHFLLVIIHPSLHFPQHSYFTLYTIVSMPL